MPRIINTILKNNKILEDPHYQILNYFKPSVALALGQIDQWNNKLYWVNWYLYGKILFLTSSCYHEQKFWMILDLDMIGQTMLLEK